jgi:hypothetical protein
VTLPPGELLWITIEGPTDLEDPALAGQIEVYLDGVAYAAKSPPLVKEFEITGPQTITIRSHIGSDDVGSHPFRLIVRGAEAPPFWIEVSA